MPKKFSFGDKVHNDPTKTNRWLTPDWIVDALGEFDLDPCGAPNHTLAAETYLLENGQDGLVLPWHGRVWLNPPYGKEMPPFIEKMAQHQNGIAFIFARTETRMFHKYVWPVAHGLLFLRGRVRFMDANKSVQADANAPSVLIAYSADDAKILAASSIPGKYVSLNPAPVGSTNDVGGLF
jgi:hypothetical protein